MADKKKTKEESEQEPKQESKKQPKDPLAELKEKNEELTNILQRVQADFENYKKQVEKNRQDYAKFSCADVISKVLPILDSFELALKSKEKTPDFTKGVELIYSQLFDMLENLGLRPIECLNKKFDPYKHEALLQEISDKPENIIIQELQKGFMLHDKVLRTSKVKITKKKEEEDGTKDSNN